VAVTLAARWLLILYGLFALRVAGQLVVVRWAPSWLPPMEQWYSGLLPYPLLLPAQVLLLVLMGSIVRSVATGRGALGRRRPGLGRVLRALSFVYWGGMALRYVVSRVLHPEWGLTGHTIPIVFHCVLAAFLFVYARHLARASDAHTRAPNILR
jgi:hypothetical protein